MPQTHTWNSKGLLLFLNNDGLIWNKTAHIDSSLWLCSTRLETPTSAVRKQLLRLPILRTCVELGQSCVAKKRKKKIIFLSLMVLQENSTRTLATWQTETAFMETLKHLTCHASAQSKLCPQFDPASLQRTKQAIEETNDDHESNKSNFPAQHQFVTSQEKNKNGWKTDSWSTPVHFSTRSALPRRQELKRVRAHWSVSVEPKWTWFPVRFFKIKNIYVMANTW